METIQPPGSLGKKYDSVRALIKDAPKNVQDKVNQFTAETRITLYLAQIRQKAGVTQQDMAQALDVTQGTISKLESGRDEELTLKVIREYSRITGERIALACGKPLTHSQAITAHVAGLKNHLEKLAEIADENDELESKIKDFFGETVFKLLDIVSTYGDNIPKTDADSEFSIEQTNKPNANSPKKETMQACETVS